MQHVFRRAIQRVIRIVHDQDEALEFRGHIGPFQSVGETGIANALGELIGDDAAVFEVGRGQAHSRTLGNAFTAALALWKRQRHCEREHRFTT